MMKGFLERSPEHDYDFYENQMKMQMPNGIMVEKCCYHSLLITTVSHAERLLVYWVDIELARQCWVVTCHK